MFKCNLKKKKYSKVGETKPELVKQISRNMDGFLPKRWERLKEIPSGKEAESVMWTPPISAPRKDSAMGQRKKNKNIWIGESLAHDEKCNT